MDASFVAKRRGKRGQSKDSPHAVEPETKDASQKQRMTNRRLCRRDITLVALLLGLFPAYSAYRCIQDQPLMRRRYRVVVSLATIPSRLQHLKPTLESLIYHQSQQPDMVYLTLPEKQGYGSKRKLNYVIPDFVNKFVRERKLLVLKPEFDYGPITKIQYALEMESYDTRIIYVDDDVIYGRHLVYGLYKKAAEFESSAVAFKGASLRDNFRQVKHTTPSFDRHPNLFFQTSGTNSFYGEKPIDVASGFAGVCVQRRFFDIPKLQKLVQEDLPDGVRKSEDFILSAHLEWRNVTRMVVAGGSAPNFNPVYSNIDRLSTSMHDNAIDAAFFLQQKLGIWTNFQFLEREDLSEDEKDAIDCEAGHEERCRKNYEKLIQQIEDRQAVA